MTSQHYDAADVHVGRRSIDEQIMVRMPVLADRALARAVRLRPGSALRRRLLLRSMQRGWDAVTRRDLELVLLYYEPDVEISNIGGGGIGLAEHYSGHSGYRDWVNDVYETWAEPRWTLKRMRDGGDRIVIEVELAAQGRGSGVEAVLNWGTVYYISSRGKIARQDAFYQDGWKLALESAGLQE